MAVTPLQLYLLLERITLLLDEAGDPGANGYRDLMDPLWYGLSTSNRQFLDSRTEVGTGPGQTIHLPLTDSLFVEPPTLTVKAPPDGPLTGWRGAA